jgi:hypothetical protein
MGPLFTALMRRGPLVCGIACLGLTGTMAISTWSSTSSPICGPPCQDARFAQAVSPEGRLEDTRRARAAVDAKLGMSPFDTGAWLRLSVLEAGGYGGPLNARSTQALENSYRLAPIDVGFTHWRLVYAFNHWKELSPGLRQSAAAEGRMMVLAGEPVIKALRGDIADPAGSLAFRFLVLNTAPGAGVEPLP